MTHPVSTCYHVLLATFGGTSLQDALESISGQPFGLQRAADQSGTHMIIDCHSADSVATYPELDSYIDASYPTFITDVLGANPENCSWEEAKSLVNTQGESGEAWSDVVVFP